MRQQVKAGIMEQEIELITSSRSSGSSVPKLEIKIRNSRVGSLLIEIEHKHGLEFPRSRKERGKP